jgi:hypothetical protein
VKASGRRHISFVARSLGMSRNTVMASLKEMGTGGTDWPASRIRKRGGGRKQLTPSASRFCPHGCDNGDSGHNTTFGVLSHGFCTRCLRFVPPSLTTTQDSLPAGCQPLPDGTFTHWVPTKGFEHRLHTHPPFLSFAWRDTPPDVRLRIRRFGRIPRLRRVGLTDLRQAYFMPILTVASPRPRSRDLVHGILRIQRAGCPMSNPSRGQLGRFGVNTFLRTGSSPVLPFGPLMG